MKQTDTFLREESIKPPNFDNNTPNQSVTNEVQEFKSPLGFGFSSVDLSDPTVKQTMKEEFYNWKNLPTDNPAKVGLEQSWYQKYYGMDTDTWKKEKKKWANDLFKSNLGQRVRHDIEALMIPVAGTADFVSDAMATLIPGYRRIDDKWDDLTKFDNKTYQAIRGLASIVIPSLYAGGTIGGSQALAATSWAKAGWLKRALLYGGANAVADGLIVGLSDQGLEHNIPGLMAEYFPDTFGTGGSHEIPRLIRTIDGESPEITKLKNAFIDFGTSYVASTIGAVTTLLPKAKSLGWFIPKDDVAKTYKSKEILKEADPDKIKRLNEIDKQLTTQSWVDEPEYEQLLMDEKMTIEGELDEIPDLGDYFRRDGVRKDREQKIAAIRKTGDPEQLELDFGFDPDIKPNLLDESTTARSIPPPGQVAKNIADTTAIEFGTSVGDPAPILTEAFQTQGMKLEGRSREAVMGVASEARDLGNFDAIVDGFRYTKKQMTAAAWDMYTSIVDTNMTADDLKEFFLDRRDIKKILNNKLEVRPLNEEATLAATYALDELSAVFLGKEVTESSARMIKTVGKEITTLAETALDFAPLANFDRLMNLTIPKMEFLMNEIALNKYISGWQLNNKKWWVAIKPENLDEAIENLTADFDKKAKAIYKKNRQFANTLREALEKHPALLKPLVDAFSVTQGNVDTIEKLSKWASDQMTPLGYIRSPNPKEMNLFAKGVWGVTMNNVLSGKSPVRAAGGAVYDLTLKPLMKLTGAMVWAGPQARWDKVQRTLYANGAWFETNTRALSFAYKMMKKAHKDPVELMKASRKDLVIVDKKKFGILDSMVPTWEKENNYGKLLMYNMSKNISDLSLHPALRAGSTALVFPDQFTNATMATYTSRLRAYDNVFTEFGYKDKAKILEAEKLLYSKAFDKNNRLRDDVAKAMAGEVNLNLDDATSTWINEATTAWPVLKHNFMFPRTQSVGMRKSFSWGPIAAIPGSNKYSKTLWAKTTDDKARALAEHGIDYYTDPNAEAVFEDLKYEYTGRVAWSSIFIGSFWQWAMAGNVNGNGHYNPSKRAKDRDTYGKRPLTIKVPGTNLWADVSWIPGVNVMVGIVGDMAMYAEDIDEAFLDNIHRKLAATISLTFANQSLFGSLEPLVELLNGNLKAFNQAKAKFFNSTVTLGSGFLSVVGKALDNSLKELDGSAKQYYMNRIPGLNSMLPEKINPATGLPVRKQSGLLGLFNAFSFVEVYDEHQGNEEITETMNQLSQIGFPGFSRLEKHSSGHYTWTPTQRQELNKIIGKAQWWKTARDITSKPEFQKDIEILEKYYRQLGPMNEDQIKLNIQDLPVMVALRKSFRKVVLKAEVEYLSRPENKDIRQNILEAQLVKDAMNKGLPEEAIPIQQNNAERNRQSIIEQLIGFPK